MGNQEVRALPLAEDRAGGAIALETAQSQPKALIPSAGQWAVLNGQWGYETVRVDQVTPKLIKTRRFGSRYSQSPRESIVALFPTEQGARELVQAIDGVRGSLRNRRIKELDRHKAEMQRIADKQAELTEAVIGHQVAKNGGRS